MTETEHWLRAGVVGRPHGLDGSFHVAEPVAALLELGTEVRLGDAHPASGAEVRPGDAHRASGAEVRPGDAHRASSAEIGAEGAHRAIVRLAGHDGRPIVRLEGCEDRSAAEALRGQALFVARVDAPELEEDEWWAADLEGCAVRDGDREVGVVARLLALPSCEVLEVTRGGEAPDLLVPLVRDAVRGVDIDARVIDVDLQFLGEA